MEKLITYILFILITIPGYAQVITWDGGGGDDSWFTADNWSGDAIPTINDDVLLTANNTTLVEIDNATDTAKCASLTITNDVSRSRMYVDVLLGALEVGGDITINNPVGRIICNYKHLSNISSAQ